MQPIMQQLFSVHWILWSCCQNIVRSIKKENGSKRKKERERSLGVPRFMLGLMADPGPHAETLT